MASPAKSGVVVSARLRIRDFKRSFIVKEVGGRGRMSGVKPDPRRIRWGGLYAQRVGGGWKLGGTKPSAWGRKRKSKRKEKEVGTEGQ